MQMYWVKVGYTSLLRAQMQQLCSFRPFSPSIYAGYSIISFIFVKIFIENQILAEAHLKNIPK